MSEEIKMFEVEYNVDTNDTPMINFYYGNYWIATYRDECLFITSNFSYKNRCKPSVDNYLDSVGLKVINKKC